MNKAYKFLQKLGKKTLTQSVMNHERITTKQTTPKQYMSKPITSNSENLAVLIKSNLKKKKEKEKRGR